MKIRVTQKHLREGKRNEADRCPLALALRDMGVETPWVEEEDIYYGGQGKRCHHTRDSLAFINSFDEGLPVHPMTFDLRIEV